MYMHYKLNLVTLQTILSNIKAYKLAAEHDPIAVNVVSLVKERKLMKEEMKSIVRIIDSMLVGPVSFEGSFANSR